MIRIILSLAVAMFPVAASVAQRAPLQATPDQGEVLFDFRINRLERPNIIPMATQRRVLTQVFGKYLANENSCRADFDPGDASNYLEAARKAGQIVPTVVDMATGSFTGPLQEQTAYVISVGECGASHADNFGSKRVAIFSGQRLVANVDVDFRSSILRKIDLNGDGVDELLMTTGDMNQGIVIETAALLGFQNGRKRVIEDFGTVIEDSCASLMPGSGATAAVISVISAGNGRMPKFRIDNYGSSCRKVKRWRKVSTGKAA